MSEALLVLNAGSSSMKFALFELRDRLEEAPLLSGQVAGIGRQASFAVCDAAGETLASGDAPRPVATHADALALLLDWLPSAGAGIPLVAAGHRVVHGGRRRTAPALVTPALLAELEALCPLAPHHQPHNLAAIRGLAARSPDLPQVACFDTAFHAGQPELERRLALPAEYAERGLLRYGFHGISYESIVSTFIDKTSSPLPERLVVAHLGNGASMCALRGGHSVATTMGFSTLDGLPMGTRCGAIDPGALLYLMRAERLGEPELTDLLYNRSGLLGVSGLSGDMRVLLGSDDPRAAEAVALYCYRIARELGSLAAALEGLDGLVFTAGIGEHAAQVRTAVCRRARWLGIELDAAANDAHATCITTTRSAVPVWVLPADEERLIARRTHERLRAEPL
jgi:acetate kinase